MLVFALMGCSLEMRGQGKEQSTYRVLYSWNQTLSWDFVQGLPCEGRASGKALRESLQRTDPQDAGRGVLRLGSGIVLLCKRNRDRSRGWQGEDP